MKYETKFARWSVFSLALITAYFVTACAHQDDSDELVALEVLESNEQVDEYGSIAESDLENIEDDEDLSPEEVAILTEGSDADNQELTAIAEEIQTLDPAPVADPMDAPTNLGSIAQAPVRATYQAKMPTVPEEAIEGEDTNLNRYYFVRQGDSPESVAMLLYGSVERAEEIEKMTPNWKAGAIVYYESPNEPDDKSMKSFYLERNVKPEIYKLSGGDTLGRISSEQYGSSESWREIALLNQLGEPSQINPGQTLALAPKDLAPYAHNSMNQASNALRPPVDNFQSTNKAEAKQASAGIGGFLKQNWLFVGSVFVIAIAALLLLVVIPKKDGY